MFFKKKISTLSVFDLIKADMHSHLLPGIDDGAADVETSIRLIKGLQQLGYKKLVTTPHILWDMYKNTNEIILEKFEVVKKKMGEEKLDVELEAAAEYYIDDHLEELLAQKKPLLSFGNKMVLVEFSLASAPFDLKDVLFEIQLQGYQPVIAHPERYSYKAGQKIFFDELKDIGCLFQLNILSLTNHYGSEVTDLAHYFCKKHYYDLVGTDLHHSRHLDALHNPSLSSQLKRLLDSGKIQNPNL
jgi:tyrosine-protein phosphatase YwqE